MFRKVWFWVSGYFPEVLVSTLYNSGEIKKGTVNLLWLTSTYIVIVICLSCYSNEYMFLCRIYTHLFAFYRKPNCQIIRNWPWSCCLLLLLCKINQLTGEQTVSLGFRALIQSECNLISLQLHLNWLTLFASEIYKVLGGSAMVMVVFINLGWSAYNFVEMDNDIRN